MVSGAQLFRLSLEQSEAKQMLAHTPVRPIDGSPQMLKSFRAAMFSAVQNQVDKIQAAKKRIFADVFQDDDEPSFMINPL